MEKGMGVWLDSEKAFLISFTDTGESIRKIESEVEHRVRFPGETKGFHRLGGMLSNPDKVHTERTKHQLSEYFNEVMHNLKDAERIYLFGPSVTKEWFEKEIKRDHALREKLIGIENADVITERQMIARTRDFFHEYDQARKKKK